MKSYINQLVTNAILGRTAMNFRNNRNNNLYTRRMWNPNRTQQFTNTMTTNRRNNRKPIKYEINDAIGGYKQVSNTGRIQEQSINMYTNIATGMDNKYYFTAGRQVNIQAMLNDEQEFLDMRKRALEYKVVQIAVNFNFNLVPTPGTRLPKMILTPEKTKIRKSK